MVVPQSKLKKRTGEGEERGGERRGYASHYYSLLAGILIVQGGKLVTTYTIAGKLVTLQLQVNNLLPRKPLNIIISVIH